MSSNNLIDEIRRQLVKEQPGGFSPATLPLLSDAPLRETIPGIMEQTRYQKTYRFFIKQVTVHTLIPFLESKRIPLASGLPGSVCFAHYNINLESVPDIERRASVSQCHAGDISAESFPDLPLSLYLILPGAWCLKKEIVDEEPYIDDCADQRGIIVAGDFCLAEGVVKEESSGMVFEIVNSIGTGHIPDMRVQADVELGRYRIPYDHFSQLFDGKRILLDESIGEPLLCTCGDVIISRGEFCTTESQYAVRMIEKPLSPMKKAAYKKTMLYSADTKLYLFIRLIAGYFYLSPAGINRINEGDIFFIRRFYDDPGDILQNIRIVVNNKLSLDGVFSINQDNMSAIALKEEGRANVFEPILDKSEEKEAGGK